MNILGFLYTSWDSYYQVVYKHEKQTNPLNSKVSGNRFFEYTNNDFCWQTHTQLLLYINHHHHLILDGQVFLWSTSYIGRTKYERWGNKRLWPWLTQFFAACQGIPINGQHWWEQEEEGQTNKQLWPRNGPIWGLFLGRSFAKWFEPAGTKRPKEHLKCFRPDILERRRGP